MKEVIVREPELIEAASEGMDAFVEVFVAAINKAIDNQLTAETMSRLNADQITLLAYHILREEVMDGGYVQLIHNGYGPFIFQNPFGKMMRIWGIDELATLTNKARKLYQKYGARICHECTDDEFMALFEQMPEFDDLDDTFVEHEEEWTAMVADYIDNHIEQFATIV